MCDENSYIIFSAVFAIGTMVDYNNAMSIVRVHKSEEVANG
jgi:hypothetical protein